VICCRLAERQTNRTETSQHTTCLLLAQMSIVACANLWICCIVHTRYRTGEVGKRVRSTSLYHPRRCGIKLKRRSDRINYTVVCFFDARLQPKVVKRVPVWAECGSSCRDNTLCNKSTVQQIEACGVWTHTIPAWVVVLYTQVRTFARPIAYDNAVNDLAPRFSLHRRTIDLAQEGGSCTYDVLLGRR